MKKLLIGLLALSSLSAFAATKRIECLSENKKVHVAIAGETDSFYGFKLETLTIVKGGIFGVDEQIHFPSCLLTQRDSVNGPWVALNCEDQNLVVNQFLNKGLDGHGLIKIGSKKYGLDCKAN